jgi:type III pantothenate kinase
MGAAVILECDIGNTRCKWRVVAGENILQRGSFRHQQGFGSLAELADLQRIRVACVAHAAVLEQFKQQLKVLGLPVEVAATAATLGDISNAYADPVRLGVDRWLAVVAAFHLQGGAALVIDAGSALTADLIDQQGRHLGGYILPGTALMKASLLADTGGVRFEKGDYSAGVVLGCSTAEAVNAGVMAAQIGAVLTAVSESGRQVQEDFAILLTGGDAELIAANLPAELAGKINHIPELVLDGLQWVLP